MLSKDHDHSHEKYLSHKKLRHLSKVINCHLLSPQGTLEEIHKANMTINFLSARFFKDTLDLYSCLQVHL
jgi:hypothetical protein